RVQLHRDCDFWCFATTPQFGIDRRGGGVRGFSSAWSASDKPRIFTSARDFSTDSATPVLQRRPTRTKRLPELLKDYVLLLCESNPNLKRLTSGTCVCVCFLFRYVFTWHNFCSGRIKLFWQWATNYDSALMNFFFSSLCM
ncbi:hypothetical protein IscW_ISCW021291, partial [Ixodes scapularis]